MISRKIGSSDIAGVTRVCNNLQILFASIPQFSDLGFLREKMPNRCVVAGCPNVPDPSKSIGLHKYPEDNDSERKTETLDRVRAKWSPTDTHRSQHFKVCKQSHLSAFMKLVTRCLYMFVHSTFITCILIFK